MTFARYSTALYLIAWFILISLPIILAGSLITLGPLFGNTGPVSGVMPSPDVSAFQLWAATVVGLLDEALLIWVIVQTRNLLNLYRQGIVLTEQAAGYIQKMGLGVLLSALSDLVVFPAQSVLLTWNNADGERQISAGINSDHMVLLLVGGALVMISWAMQQAVRAADENKAFV